MTDEEKQQAILAENDGLALLRRIEEVISKAKAQRAEQFAQFNLQRPWRAHGIKKEHWIVGTLNYSPSFFDQELKLIKRHGGAISQYIKSRLVPVLSHKWESDEQERAWVDKWCGPEVSHEHYISALAELKGNPDPLGCNCRELVFLTKCKTCGKVKKDAHSKD